MANNVPTVEGPPVYRLRNVKKMRKKGDVSFEMAVPSFIVNRGRFVSVVGPSGCGKSTLLDMLALVLRQDSAEEFFISSKNGQNELTDVSGLNDNDLAEIRKSSIGYVLQTGGLLPFLSVKDNILLPCRLNKLSSAEPVAREMAELLGIADQLSKKPQHLSGGQRQRAAIARALVHRPAIVLADEPTAAVDKLTAVDIIGIFRKLTRQLGVTLVMVTHDPNLVEGAADQIFGFDITRKGATHTFSEVLEGK